MTQPGSEPPANEEPPPLPPDPEAYDHPRAQLARAKGLDAPYIAGGDDPEPEKARQEERRLLRILVAMIVVVVLSGFVLGALAVVVQNLT